MMDDLKVFSKEDTFRIMVSIVTNIIGNFSIKGLSREHCFNMLDEMTRIANGTLVHEYQHTPEEVQTYAATGLLDMHNFTAADRGN